MTAETRPLEGRVALVTGSGRNIGRATILELARLGADVAVNARSNRDEAESVVAEAKEFGVRAIARIADVGNQHQAFGLIGSVTAEFEKIDILVNNAGMRASKRFADMTVEEWREVNAVNMDAPFFTSKAVVRGMIERGLGTDNQRLRAECLHGKGGVGARVRGQDGRAWADSRAGGGTGSAWHTGESHSSRRFRHKPSRGPERSRRTACRDTSGPTGTAGGDSRYGRVPRLRGRELHHRPDDTRQRRSAEGMIGRTISSNPPMRFNAMAQRFFYMLSYTLRFNERTGHGGQGLSVISRYRFCRSP